MENMGGRYAFPAWVGSCRTGSLALTHPTAHTLLKKAATLAASCSTPASRPATGIMPLNSIIPLQAQDEGGVMAL
jgi:hypothetical protein